MVGSGLAAAGFKLGTIEDRLAGHCITSIDSLEQPKRRERDSKFMNCCYGVPSLPPFGLDKGEFISSIFIGGFLSSPNARMAGSCSSSSDL